ncbi:MAG: hypothetical protein PVH74_17825, partial [Desulfobacterales bacterium]
DGYRLEETFGSQSVEFNSTPVLCVFKLLPSARPAAHPFAIKFSDSSQRLKERKIDASDWCYAELTINFVTADK